MSEQVDALLDRVTAVLDVFDLSFIISGGSGMGAILAALLYHDATPVSGFNPAWFWGVGLIVVTYVLGLICFAVGRRIRETVRFLPRRAGKEPTVLFELSLLGVSLSPQHNSLLSNSRSDGSEPLYNLCWAQMRHDRSRNESLRLLTRHWVLAATCDGVAASLLLWYGTFLCVLFTQDTFVLTSCGRFFTALLAWLLTGFLMLLLFKESCRCKINQTRELAATIAVASYRLSSPILPFQLSDPGPKARSQP